MEEEEWRPVLSHDGYDVSSTGKVRSWRRMGPKPRVADESRLLRPTPAVGGRYAQVTLAAPRRKRYVHHLVAEAFLGPRPEGLDVAHWDGDGLNNVVSNLRYASAAENMADKLRHGTSNRGNHAKFRKLSQADVDEIRERYGPYVRYGKGRETQRALAAEFGVTWQRIGSIVRGETWQFRMDRPTHSLPTPLD